MRYRKYAFDLRVVTPANDIFFKTSKYNFCTFQAEFFPHQNMCFSLDCIKKNHTSFFTSVTLPYNHKIY